MQNRKLADVVIIAGWNAGTATRCAGFIGNIRAKHSSVAAAGWNIFQTTKFARAAIVATKSPRHQTGKILNGALFFLAVGMSSRSSGVYRSRTRRRPRPRYGVFSPVFSAYDGLDLREDSSVCDIGTANMAIRGRGRRRVRERCADERELVPTGT
jgi:hypothetical protein